MHGAGSRGLLRHGSGQALRSADSGRDDTKKDDAENFGETRGNLTPNPFPWGKGNNRVGWRRNLDAEIRNRCRLRCAELSEVLPRSEPSLATVRMTGEMRNRYDLVLRDWECDRFFAT